MVAERSAEDFRHPVGWLRATGLPRHPLRAERHSREGRNLHLIKALAVFHGAFEAVFGISTTESVRG